MMPSIRTISSAVVATSAALLFCGASPLVGQSITVRVLNARSGLPLSGQNVTIAWADTLDKTVVNLGRDGSGKLDLAGRSQFAMLPGPKLGKEPYRIAYIDCNNFSMVRVDDVLNRGLVSENLCSAKVSAKAKPGEVVFWAVPLHWWEPDLQ
ncbi:MAG TPA: hypothetical protein VFA99_14675 [Acidobacteriaceae bacterium]|nr:hypothetical protein [Acidobacteriaceae bacterium]